MGTIHLLLNDLEMIKNWVNHEATSWLWTQELSIGIQEPWPIRQCSKTISILIYCFTLELLAYIPPCGPIRKGRRDDQREMVFTKTADFKRKDLFGMHTLQRNSVNKRLSLNHVFFRSDFTK